MKKNLLIALIVLMAGAITSAHAQENVFKINILSPVFQTLNLSYERKLSATGSFQLGFFYTGYNSGGSTFRGIGITPEYRFYLSETEAPNGVYVAPYMRYQNFELNEEDNNSIDKGTLTLFGGGLIIGKQWIFKEKISLDVFIGPQYSSGNVKVVSGTDNFDNNPFDGFTVRAGLTLGFAF